MKFIEFDYDTVNGDTLLVEGKIEGSTVKFIAYNQDHFPVPNSQLTKLDVRNIEEFITENSEEELDFFDLDYRGER